LSSGTLFFCDHFRLDDRDEPVEGEGRLDAFRTARDEIESRILEWLEGDAPAAES
jgi:hypothetical protein